MQFVRFNMWKPDVLYRHNNNYDVAFEVLRADLDDDTWRLQVSWWNIGSCHAPWPIGVKDAVKISAASVLNGEWNEMSTDERGPKPHDQAPRI